MRHVGLWLLAITLFLRPAAAFASVSPARLWNTIERPRSAIAYRGVNAGVVKAVQYLLRAHGHKVVIDGKFGTQTESAIQAFQSRRKLPATGELNGRTWEALVIPCKTGSKGDAVRAVQTLLRQSDYDIPVNGKYGPATRASVMSYQKQNRLAVDGMVGKYTWCRLVGGDIEVLGPD